MFSKLILIALGAASTVSALVPRAACNADNCLRALRASSPATRLAQAQNDCSSWLVVTTTPVETATTYNTVLTLTETLFEEVTAVNMVHDVFTSTVHETPTETVYTSTITVTVPPIHAVTKRALAAIPTYASACSGAVRYSSACSCIGVSSASTAIAPASTTTVTLDVTAQETVEATTVVATSITVVFDSTVTATVTELANTVYAVATVTETAAPKPTLTGKFKVTSPTRGDGYFGMHILGSNYYGLYTADPAAAVTLDLKPDGTLWYGSRIANGDPNGFGQVFFFVDPASPSNRAPLSCNMDTNDVLSCVVPNKGNNKIGMHPAGNPPILYTASASEFAGVGYQILTVKGIRA